MKDKIELQILSYCLEGKNLKENEAVIDTTQIRLWLNTKGNITLHMFQSRNLANQSLILNNEFKGTT